MRKDVVRKIGYILDTYCQSCTREKTVNGRVNRDKLCTQECEKGKELQKLGKEMGRKHG